MWKLHANLGNKLGTIWVDNLEITNINEIYTSSNEEIALAAEFIRYINAYLKELMVSPVRSLADFDCLQQEKLKIGEYNWML